MNITPACGSPTPKTTCVRPFARRHLVQVAAADASSSRVMLMVQPLPCPGGSANSVTTSRVYVRQPISVSVPGIVARPVQQPSCGASYCVIVPTSLLARQSPSIDLAFTTRIERVRSESWAVPEQTAPKSPLSEPVYRAP